MSLLRRPGRHCSTSTYPPLRYSSHVVLNLRRIIVIPRLDHPPWVPRCAMSLKSPANFQPYDRDTGAELSPQQQSDCQVHYSILKAYIDEVEYHHYRHIQWTRKKLRCSTTELLESIEKLSQEIRKHGKRDDTQKSSALDFIHGEHHIFVAEDDIPTDFYPEAVNLLHELVNRLVEPPATASADTIETTQAMQRLSVSGSVSNSSDVSGAFSNRPISMLTSASTRTASSMTSEENKGPSLSHLSVSGQPETSTHEVFDRPSSENAAKDGFFSEKKQATNDWVLEYLRGGWASHSPAEVSQAVISPIFPFSENASPAGDFHSIQRTDSDEALLLGDERTFRKGAGLKIQKPSKLERGRPIPTMASRFMGKVGQEDMHAADRHSSSHSGVDYFKTPKSILSGNTLFCTPDSGPKDGQFITKARLVSFC